MAQDQTKFPARHRSRRIPVAIVGAALIAGALALLLRAPLGIAPSSGHAARLTGAESQLAVLDAGTLRIGRQIVRLDGVAAPANGTICHGDSRMEFDCAAAATNALASMVRGNEVECTVQGRDQHGLPIGDCEAAGQPLNRRLVRDGWAHAAIASLQDTEAEARTAHRGIWRPLES